MHHPSRPRFRPRLEALEDRLVLTTASKVGGTLVVNGPVTGVLSIVETGANSFTVQDGVLPLTPFAGVLNVSVSTGAANDTVDFNFNGFTFLGSVGINLGIGDNVLTVRRGGALSLGVVSGQGNDNINVNLTPFLGFTGLFPGTIAINAGAGTNTVSVHDGTVVYLSVATGSGLDAVNLSNLTVAQNAAVNLGGTFPLVVENFTLPNTVSVLGSFSVVGANDVDINGSIGLNLLIGGLSTGNTVDINPTASIGQDLIYSSPGISTGATTLTVNANVGRDLRFTSSTFNQLGNTVILKTGRTVGRDMYISGTEKADTVTVENGATITRDLAIFAGDGDDIVTIGTATIGRTAYFYLAGGNDTLDFSGTAGAAAGQAFYVDAGAGNDAVTIQAAALFKGKGTVYLGAGNDSFTNLALPAKYTMSFTVDGGIDTDPGDTFSNAPGAPIVFTHFP